MICGIKEALASAIRDVDIVHFATHGRFDSEDVSRSGIALRSGQWLTLADMQHLTFKDGALVFLSACETARLELAGRSTPLGIVPSLFEGGASTVIATFWKVNDLSTALVAARFYEPGFPIWLWYFCPFDQSSSLEFRGFLERHQATEGDTQWVNYKRSPFSSRSTDF